MPAYTDANLRIIKGVSSINNKRLPNRFSLHWISRDGKLIIITRGVCTFARSSIAVLLAIYLAKLGLSMVQIGVFLSAGVAGSAFLSFLVSLISEKVGRRRLLVTFTLMTAVAGLAMVFVDDFLPLLFFSFIGGIASGGMGGANQPLEQASLTDTATPDKRTDLFAVYRIVAVSGTALGALAAGLPSFSQNVFGLSEILAYKAMFVGFAFFLFVAALLYGLLSPSVEAGSSEQRWVNPFRLPSRRLIFTLSGLFSLDSFAGALFMESLAAYWFYSRFGMELETLALVFFVSHLLAAISLGLAAKLANRIGLINTMVFTHIPGSLFLIGATFAPTAWIAVIFWQMRAFLSRMDVPTRDSYTMSVVGPNERVAMAGINAVGRSASGTIAPSIATVLWQAFSSTVPLVGSAVLKITYDLSLYFMFRNVKPPQELNKDSDSQ
ncbi:MFS transporter [Chloroflexota bacterium]